MVKALIGLGNPGQKFIYTRHNIGFRILEAFGDIYNAQWHTKGNMELAEVVTEKGPLLLIKPQTFMNNSGQVIPFLLKKGIKSEEIIVIHDELELPFGVVKYKKGGSAKGHNGLKSIIGVCGEGFGRLRFGIGRPELREDVPDYVLARFTEHEGHVTESIAAAVSAIRELL